MKKAFIILGFGLSLAAFSHAGSVSFKIGYFMPRADSDLWAQNIQNFTLKKSDFNQFSFMAETDFFLGNYVNFEVGTGYYEKEVQTEDREFQFSDDQPIRQTLKLRIVPFEGSIKIYPLGRERPILPYVGAGMGAYFWQYEENGDFVVDRATNPRLISGVFYSEAASPGYHVKAGVQVPVGRATIDAEIKYIRAHGNLSSDFDPAFEPFDLSGLQTNFGVSFWY